MSIKAVLTEARRRSFLLPSLPSLLPPSLPLPPSRRYTQHKTVKFASSYLNDAYKTSLSEVLVVNTSPFTQLRRPLKASSLEILGAARQRDSDETTLKVSTEARVNEVKTSPGYSFGENNKLFLKMVNTRGN